MSIIKSKMDIVDYATDNVIGEATMEDAKLICYCNIVDPLCNECEMTAECTKFVDKYKETPILCSLKAN